MLTLTQAAAEIGRTRSTLLNSIKSGRLSATKDERGHYLIDPVELHRAYMSVNVSEGNQTKQPDIARDTSETVFLRRENELLKQQVEREREQADHWRKQATMLIEHRPAHTEPMVSLPGGGGGQRLWKKLFWP